jgi:hypothetical protein
VFDVDRAAQVSAQQVAPMLAAIAVDPSLDARGVG